MSATAADDALVADLAKRLGERYEVLRLLGRGGMGAICLARDRSLDRPVALKVLPPEFAANPELRERFLRETRTAASFSHPNIVPVFAVEERDGLLAFAMGFVEGETLAERVRRAGPLTVREAVRLLQDVGYALAYAHGRGVVHRDIKPENIMLERATGRALAMDFGVARAISASTTAPGLTRVGEVVGTPAFMSPEQASGDEVDGRSDLYSLGLVAFYALTGRQAATGETTQQLLVWQLTQHAPPVASLRGEIPAPLAAVVDRCLLKDPAERFPGAEALVEALDQAHLAAPEIPLAVRLFSQEAATLGLIVVFTTLLGWVLTLFFRARQAADLDSFLPLLLLFAIVMTRVMQAASEAWRLGQAGFTRGEIQRGMRAVVAEREQWRADVRADPVTRRRRRITLVIAAGQLLVGLVMARAAFLWRIPNPTRPGDWIVLPAGLVLIISAVFMVGVGFVLLVRSPFRMPIGERLFRLFWLGPPGRLFLRVARVPGDRAGTAMPIRVLPIAPVPPAATAAGVPDARLARLESRVDALERLRERWPD